MQTVSINIFEFNELSEVAKKKVLKDLNDINVFYDWWEFIYEDAENVGIKIEAFELYPNSIELKIDGSYKDAAELIIKNHREGTETYIAATNFLKGAKEDSGNEGVYFIRSLKREYLRLLELDYEYRLSNKAIIETIEDNDYQFFVDGTIFYQKFLEKSL